MFAEFYVFLKKSLIWWFPPLVLLLLLLALNLLVGRQSFLAPFLYPLF